MSVDQNQHTKYIFIMSAKYKSAKIYVLLLCLILIVGNEIWNYSAFQPILSVLSDLV